MSIRKSDLIKALSPPLPNEVVVRLLDDYQEIKQQFFLRKFQPSELDGGRFAESVLRLLEFQHSGIYTSYGKQLKSEEIINKLVSNANMHESERILIPRQCRVLLDIRNKRNVAHPAGDVDPNYSDAILIVHGADWILTELIRLYYTCTINEARSLVTEVNEVSIPLIADIDGFLRVQDAKMECSDKVLVLLYHKDPIKVKDKELIEWTRYKNPSRFQKLILSELDKACLIHHENGECTLLPKGKLFVEKNIPLELLP